MQMPDCANSAPHVITLPNAEPSRPVNYAAKTLQGPAFEIRMAEFLLRAFLLLLTSPAMWAKNLLPSTHHCASCNAATGTHCLLKSDGAVSILLFLSSNT